MGRYDRSHPLVIDPVLVYSASVSGSASSQGNAIAVDSNGNAYIVGTTTSTSFQTTANAFQVQNNSALAGNGGTVFVSEMNAAGTALVYSTFLGGSGGDAGNGIALDSAGNAYVTGATNSPDFPITCGAFLTTDPSLQNGKSTAFVAKLNAGGSSLAYSTFLGGSGQASGDAAQAIAVDGKGDAYVTGLTDSTNFPVTDEAFQEDYAGSGGANAFVTELNPAGTALLYSTYLGGSGGDYANAIAIDGSGDAFVTGGTSSANFPVTDGAFQTAFHGASAFVTELNPSGTAEVYSTFLAGSGGDSATAIAIDGNGFAYVIGSTSSSDFPVTQGVLEGPGSRLAGVYGPVALAAKLNQDGSALEYATYLEGWFSSANGLAVDAAGDAHVSGTAYSGDYGLYGGFQGTPGAIAGFASDAYYTFVAKLNPAATVLNYATLIGSGGSGESLTAIALDSNGNAYLSGLNAFVTKLALADEVNLTTYPGAPAGSMSIQVSAGAVQCSNFAAWTMGYNWLVQYSGPPPSGTVSVSWQDPDMAEFYNFQFEVSDTEDSALVYNNYEIPGADGAEESYVVSYPGDSNYGPLSIPGSTTLPNCDVQAAQQLRLDQQLLLFSGRPIPSARSNGTAPISSPANLVPEPRAAGPKFPLPIQAQPARIGAASRISANQVQGLPACIVPGSGPLLTVVANPVSRPYGTSNPTLTYTVTGLRNGDQITVKLATTATPKSSVGVYPVTLQVSGAALTKYALEVTPATLTVTRASLSVIADSFSRVYGSENPKLTGSVTGLRNGDSITVALSTGAKFTSSAGTHPISVRVTGTALANYKVSIKQGMLRITPAPLTVTVLPASASRMYRGTNPKFSCQAIGLRNGDTVSPITTALADSPAGDYPVTALVSPSADNYTITMHPANLIVTRVPVTVTMVPATASRLYGAKNPTFAITKIDGLLNGDKVSSYAYGAGEASPVGHYNIWAALGGPAAKNYKVENRSAILTVEPAPLILYALSLDSTYGDTIKPKDYSFAGFVNGDTKSVVSGSPQLSTKATAASQVGRYPILIAAGTLKAVNYSITTVGSTAAFVNVGKAPLKVTANNLTMKQGGRVPNLTYTVSGFVNHDTLDIVTGAPVLSTTATSASQPGNYPITLARGSLRAENYSFTPVSGVLTVEP